MAERRLRVINGEIERLLAGPHAIGTIARETTVRSVSSLTDDQKRALVDQHVYELMRNDDLFQLDPSSDPEGVLAYLRLAGELVDEPGFDARKSMRTYVEAMLDIARSAKSCGRWRY